MDELAGVVIWAGALLAFIVVGALTWLWCWILCWHSVVAFRLAVFNSFLAVLFLALFPLSGYDDEIVEAADIGAGIVYALWGWIVYWVIKFRGRRRVPDTPLPGAVIEDRA